MISFQSIFIRIWRECLKQGYTILDAKEYAQLEVDSLRLKDKPITIADFSEEKGDLPPLPLNPPNAPKKIFAEPKEKSYFSSFCIPKFIKLPNSEKARLKLQKKWAKIKNKS